MKSKTTYHESESLNNIQKLRNVLETLPSFVKDYFRALEINTSPKTRISYSYDIRIFFNFLVQKKIEFKNKKITDITLDQLDFLRSVDIEEYLEYLKLYQDIDNRTQQQNQ